VHLLLLVRLANEVVPILMGPTAATKGGRLLWTRAAVSRMAMRTSVRTQHMLPPVFTQASPAKLSHRH
jgi:hypothetical protein